MEEGWGGRRWICDIRRSLVNVQDKVYFSLLI